MRCAIYRRLVVIVALLMIPVGASAAYEEVEDLVTIIATGSRFIAVIDGKRTFSEDYRLGETVAWQGAKGEIGAFLTNMRFLAISIKSGQWNSQYLKIEEKQNVPETLLAAHLVLMLTHERIVAFGTDTGGFVETRLPLGESVNAKDAQGRVAAAVTPTRAFGFSASRRGAAEIRLRRQETVVSLKTTYRTITLQTSQRLFSLEAADAVWREIELD